MAEKIRVSAAEFVRHVGVWQERALQEPIAITYHGRERLILASAERFGAVSKAGSASEALDQLTAILVNMSEGFVAFDAQLQIIAANQVTETYLGRSARALVGQTPDTVFPVQKGAMLVNHMRHVILTRDALRFETGSLLFPGSRFQARIFPLGGGAGMIYANLTERVTRRTDLAEADALKASLVQFSDLAVVKCDMRGRIISVEARFSDWVGFEATSLVQRKLSDIAVPALRAELADALDQAQEQHVTLRTRLLARDLKERPFTLVLSPIRGTESTIGVFVVARLESEQGISGVQAGEKTHMR